MPVRPVKRAVRKNAARVRIRKIRPAAAGEKPVFPDNTALYPIPISQLVSRCNLDVGRCAAALQLTLVYFFFAVAHTVGKRRCMQWRIMRK